MLWVFFFLNEKNMCNLISAWNVNKKVGERIISSWLMWLGCFYYSGERLGRGIVTDGITTPVVNTSAYFFKNTAELIDFKVLPFPANVFIYLVFYLLDHAYKWLSRRNRRDAIQVLSTDVMEIQPLLLLRKKLGLTIC